MAIVMNDEILLESGTNEMQIMEFSIDGVLYGINVAKVQQIMISEPVKFMPHTHEAVEAGPCPTFLEAGRGGVC